MAFPPAERRRGRSQPVRLAQALASYLDGAGLAPRVEQAGVVAAWPALVGPEIARVAKADSVAADGTLFVRVASAGWRQELSLMAPEIVAAINRGRKPGTISRIRWLGARESAPEGNA